MRERIFERFARGGGRRRAGGGSGLGLAIVRAVAEAHGGGRGRATPEGGGARFVVTLPLAARAEAAECRRADGLVSRGRSIRHTSSSPNPQGARTLKRPSRRPTPSPPPSSSRLLALSVVARRRRRTAWPRGFIDSREIKNNTVAAQRPPQQRHPHQGSPQQRGPWRSTSATAPSRAATSRSPRSPATIREATLSAGADRARASWPAVPAGALRLSALTTRPWARAQRRDPRPLVVTAACRPTSAGACATGCACSYRGGSARTALSVLRAPATARSPCPLVATGQRAVEPLPSSPGRHTPALSGVEVASPTVHGTVVRLLRLRRAGRGRLPAQRADLDLDDHRQDHRPALAALVDELRHVVVEVVLQQVDLA